MFHNQSFGYGPDTMQGHSFKEGCGRRGHRFGPPWMRHRFAEAFNRHFNRVPVNIEETDTAFELSLFAAGLQKELIRVYVKDDVLTVAYQAKEQQEMPDEPWQFNRREHAPGAFERSFQLNGKVKTAEITSSYTDGILRITLPKDPATNSPAQNIQVG